MTNDSEIPNDESAPRLKSYIVPYLQSLKVKAYSEVTIRDSERRLRAFVDWCETRSVITAISLTRAVIQSYQRHLFYYRKANGKPLKSVTQNNNITSIKMFMRWLTRENHLAYSPAEQIELAKLPRQLPRAVLSVKHIQKLFSIPDTNTLLGVRDRAILETFYSTGMRRSELAGLQMRDVDEDQGVIFIRQGKGGHQRLVPIGETALEWLLQYKYEVRPLYETEDEQTLFLYDNGEPFLKARLSALVKRLMQSAGINAEGSCHLLRHACATHLLEAGMDLRLIQQLLGHAKADTTAIYTHVAIGKLKEVHGRLL